MAIGSSVPPRAYTREILTTAFNWLQSQPDSVRTKATTPDALVGLYMQAQRSGIATTGFDAEAPVSSQAFMSDLKNLARGLEEFEESRPNKAVPPPASSRAQLGQSTTYPQPAQTSMTIATPPSTAGSVAAGAAPALAAPAAMAASAAPTKVQKSLPLEDFEPPTAPVPSNMASEPGFTDLNARSLEMLREVQLAMNLTSEVEALNLMIAMAHKSLKSLLA